MSTPANDLNISQAGLVVFNGVSTFTGVSLIGGAGVTITNGNGIAGNPVIALSGGGAAIETLSDDVNASVSPIGSPENIQLIGHVVEQGATKFSTIVAGTHLLNINPMSSARWIVDPLGFNGTHTTIASAITSATSGDTIFLMPGTFTENPTLKAGVNLTAWGSDSSLDGSGKVIINGTCTLTTAGSVTISGMQLQTNSAALLAVTGSAASIVNLNNCYLNCSNTTGITYSSSNAASAININNCSGNIVTTGVSLFTQTSAGMLSLNYSKITNTGASTTASTISAGTLNINSSLLNIPITSSSTGTIIVIGCDIDNTATNTTCLTIGGATTSGVFNSLIASGTASAITISVAGFACNNNIISSGNTNAITGSGTINYSNLSFTSTSKTINTTTQGIAGIAFGLTTITPTAGMIGEQIRSAIALDAVTITTTGTAQNLTSISLTAGVWDISGLIEYKSLGGTFSSCNCSIGTTSATLGTAADNNVQMPGVVGTSYVTVAIPAWRLVISSTTTVYLVAFANFTVTQPTAGGRISATRVG